MCSPTGLVQCFLDHLGKFYHRFFKNGQAVHIRIEIVFFQQVFCNEHAAIRLFRLCGHFLFPEFSPMKTRVGHTEQFRVIAVTMKMRTQDALVILLSWLKHHGAGSIAKDH